MKIEDLYEAPPGVGRGVLGLNNLKGRSQLGSQVNAAYDLWVRLVPKLAGSGTVNMRDPNTYATYFGTWMARNLRLTTTDPIVRNAIAALQRQPLTKGALKSTIKQMMGQQRAQALAVPQQQAPAQAAASPAQTSAAPSASAPAANQWNATATPGGGEEYGKAIPGGGARNTGPMTPVAATSQPATSASVSSKGPPEGSQSSAGDIYYTVKGGQWRRNDNGEPASSTIAKLLSQQVGA